MWVQRVAITISLPELGHSSRYPPDPAVAVEYKIAGFESIFFKILELDAEDYPSVSAGFPKVLSWQIREFQTQTLKVASFCENPDAVGIRFFVRFPESKEELLV
jgi:hypothetical protein